MKKVSVYIPCFNYGHYVDEAIKSIIRQTMSDWELIIINDGSTDKTAHVIKKYSSHPNIKIITQENKGLNSTNNIALRLSSGKYIMRLDADDYLDENALLVMSNVLDRNPDIGLVYPDYYHIDQNGNIIEIVRRKRIGDEVHILDLPAHGACTIFRKDVLLQIGGYAEEFSCQDGYEVWLKFINKHRPYNVNIPLFYYRQHSENLTRDSRKIFMTREAIKEKFVKKYHGNHSPNVLGIIPIVRSSIYSTDDPFTKIAGKPLIWYTINAALKSEKLNKIIVSSDDKDVLKYAARFKRIICHKRRVELARQISRVDDLIIDILKDLEKKNKYKPDAVCILYINSPMRRAEHIDNAVNTMIIFNVDSVISVEEELSPCYNHRKFGLKPIRNVPQGLKLEKDAIFKDKGLITLSKIHVFKERKIIGEKIGHITIPPEEGIRIKSEFDRWFAEKVITEWRVKERQKDETRA